MKLIDTTCPKCGANLHIDAECQSAFCEYCGGQILIDDGGMSLQFCKENFAKDIDKYTWQ